MLNKLEGKLTVEKLKFMDQGAFAKGTFIDSPEGINMASTGLEVRRIAVRGWFHDRAIYSQNPHYINSKDPILMSMELDGVRDRPTIIRQGDKIPGRYARKLVDCDDEALKLYRS